MMVGLEKITKPHYPIDFYGPIPRVYCKDGFNMSVQASKSMYCVPREDRAWPYIEFEVGFPSSEEPLIYEYAEESRDLCKTVYGYVPAEIINKVIKKHRGIIWPWECFDWMVPEKFKRYVDIHRLDYMEFN